jgi:tRNA pseudouridine13 synthase
MYIHSYQSYIWNAIVSQRVRTYGASEPVVGDLVFENEPDCQVSEDSDEGGQLGTLPCFAPSRQPTYVT